MSNKNNESSWKDEASNWTGKSVVLGFSKITYSSISLESIIEADYHQKWSDLSPTVNYISNWQQNLIEREIPHDAA